MSKAQANTSFEIGTRLKSARLMRRLSQRELARKSGVTNGLISQIEQNHSSPSVSTLKRILDAIPMSLTDFFTEESQGDAQVFFRADELHELTRVKSSIRWPEGKTGFHCVKSVSAAIIRYKCCTKPTAQGRTHGPRLYSQQRQRDRQHHRRSYRNHGR